MLSYTCVRLCHQFPLQVHPILLNRELCAASAVSQPSYIQIIFVSTLTLEAEVLWILNTDAVSEFRVCILQRSI